jgi:hypothetical protein
MESPRLPPRGDFPWLERALDSTEDRTAQSAASCDDAGDSVPPPIPISEGATDMADASADRPPWSEGRRLPATDAVVTGNVGLNSWDVSGEELLWQKFEDTSFAKEKKTYARVVVLNTGTITGGSRE